MKMRRTITAVVIGLALTGSLSACSSSSKHGAVGPNSNLPAMNSPTSGCDKMDDILSNQLTKTAEGKAFVEATSEKNYPDDPAKEEARNKNVDQKWMAFLKTLTSGKIAEKMDKASSQDETAKKAWQAVKQYYANKEKLASGTIPAIDEEATKIAVSEGKDPVENPEYTKIADQITDNHLTASKCMPSWPVVF